MEEKNKGEMIEGFSLSGEEVSQLTDKKFTIQTMPYYVDIPSLDNKDAVKRKLIVPVQLMNGTIAEWYANKTSQKVIISKRGRILKDWIGYEGEFITKNQVVGKEERQVIYLK